MKRMYACLVIAGLSLTLPGSVMAVPPEIVQFPLAFQDNLGSCGDFEILRDAQYTITQTTFFGNAGEVVRVIYRWDGTETWSNSVTGFSFAGMPFHGLLEFIPSLDAPQDQLTRGFFLGAHFPGLGMVFLNAGNVTFDLISGDITFQAGAFDLFPELQLEKLCAALQGPAKPGTPGATWGMVKQLYK